MKKIIYTFTILLFVLKSFSQTPTPSKDYYLQKSKNQKNSAWIMLGGGVAMTTIGMIQAINNFSLFEPSTKGEFLVAAGIGTALGSIPFFISSSKNARKAATISFNNQNILMLQQNSFVSKMQPTITLKISL